MEIEDMIDAASTLVDNIFGELPPSSLEQINLRPEGKSAGGVASQELAPPIQENLRSKEATVSGVVTQEPTPPIQENMGSEVENVSGTVTQEPTPLTEETLASIKEK